MTVWLSDGLIYLGELRGGGGGGRGGVLILNSA